MELQVEKFDLDADAQDVITAAHVHSRMILAICRSKLVRANVENVDRNQRNQAGTC